MKMTDMISNETAYRLGGNEANSLLQNFQDCRLCGELERLKMIEGIGEGAWMSVSKADLGFPRVRRLEATPEPSSRDMLGLARAAETFGTAPNPQDMSMWNAQLRQAVTAETTWRKQTRKFLAIDGNVSASGSTDSASLLAEVSSDAMEQEGNGGLFEAAQGSGANATAQTSHEHHILSESIVLPQWETTSDELELHSPFSAGQASSNANDEADVAVIEHRFSDGSPTSPTWLTNALHVADNEEAQEESRRQVERLKLKAWRAWHMEERRLRKNEMEKQRHRRKGAVARMEPENTKRGSIGGAKDGGQALGKRNEDGD